MTIINTGYTWTTEQMRQNRLERERTWQERKEFRLLQVEKEQARQWAEMFALDDDVIRNALWMIDVEAQGADHADLDELRTACRNG